MILRRLELRGFRCFRNRVELSGLGVGPHVIFAANEAGKSTLILALARALFDRYSTTGEDMKGLRPWGTTLSPEVEVELEAGGNRYLLKKRFLDGARSELLEWTGAQFERKDDGDRADERARRFFLGDPSGRGATKVEHWGMARLLWLTQRRERQEPPGTSESFQTRLLSVVGAALLSDEEQRLLARIEEEKGKFFTGGGKATKHSPLLKAQGDLCTAEREVSDLTARRDEATAWAEQIEDAQRRLDVAGGELVALRGRLKDIEQEVQAEQDIERQLQVNEAEAESLAERFDERRKRREAVLERTKDGERARADAGAMTSSIHSAVIRAKADASALGAAVEAVKRACVTMDRLDQQRERARSVAEIGRLRDERRRLRKKAEDAGRLAERIAQQEQRQARQPAPTERDVSPCEDLQKKIEIDEAKLDDLAIEVAFVPDKACQVAWEGLDSKPSHRVTSGQRAVFRGADRGTLTIAGVGTLAISTGMRDAATLKGQIEGRRKDLARRLGARGAPSVEALRQMCNEGAERRRELVQFKRTLAEVLDDLADLEALHGALRACDGRIAELAEAIHVPAGEVDQLACPNPKAVEAQWKEARKEKVAAERACAEAKERAKASEERAGELQRGQDAKVIEASTLEANLAADELRFGSPERLLAEENDLAGKLALARSAIQGLQARLPAPHARASRRKPEIDAEIQRTEIQRQRRQREVDALQGKLEQAVGEGIYSRLGLAEERCELARREVARLEPHAAGLMALSELGIAWRDRARRSVVAPIEREVRIRLDYIRGSAARGTAISFTPDLSEATVRAATGEAASLDALSWGTQEQVMLCLRLALGCMLTDQGADDEAHIVVLDDALANTDIARHARALDLIQSAAERLQILILTAFPERYRALKAAEHDLAALMATSSP